jgi:uncharacterized membrane protein HdeD (DUF308 family)
MAIAPAGVAPDTDVAERAWYLFAVSGAVSLVIGVLVLAYPSPSIKLLGVFLGIDLLIAGVLLIARAMSGGEETRAAEMLLGTLALIAGLIVVRNPARSLELLTLAFAVYLVVAGALALGRGLVHSRQRWSTLARGAVLVAAGTVIISWPEMSVKTLTVLAGIALILQGAMEVAEGFALRSPARHS